MKSHDSNHAIPPIRLAAFLSLLSSKLDWKSTLVYHFHNNLSTFTKNYSMTAPVALILGLRPSPRHSLQQPKNLSSINSIHPSRVSTY